jgi:hypothetical protein
MKLENHIIYHYLDLPISIGSKEDLITSECLYDNKELLEILSHKKHIQSQVTELPLARYTRYKIDNFVEKIISAVPELKDHIRDVGLQNIYNESLDTRGSKMMPHTDGVARGRHCIQWLFETGGSDVHTTWYIEDNYTALRYPAIAGKDFKNLNVIEDVIFDVKKWAIFKTNIIHSVQTIHTSRKALTIGFSNEQLFDQLIEKYGVSS